MIKRLTVFLIFIVQTTVPMKATYRYICSTCEATFDNNTHEKIMLYCSYGAEKLLNKHPHSTSLQEEYYRHRLCLYCVRQILEGKKILCPACSDCREITLDEAYDCGAVSWCEYCLFYIQKFGELVGRKITQAKAVIDSFSEEIDDNTHPLAIELSVLLN